MIHIFSTTFKNSIENSPQLQLDFLLCDFLHRTPGELRELEREGLLTLEQKIFIQAGIMWKREHFDMMCPFLK